MCFEKGLVFLMKKCLMRMKMEMEMADVTVHRGWIASGRERVRASVRSAHGAIPGRNQEPQQSAQHALRHSFASCPPCPPPQLELATFIFPCAGPGRLLPTFARHADAMPVRVTCSNG